MPSKASFGVGRAYLAPAAKNALKPFDINDLRGMVRHSGEWEGKPKWCPEEDSNLHALASAST